MCPREQLTRPIGFMSLEDFSLTCSRIPSFSGIFHLHGFGEPLLDRSLPKKLEKLQESHPQAKSIVFSTLGVKFHEGFLERILSAGLTNLVISFYGFSQESYKAIHGFDGLALVKDNLKLLSHAKKTTGSSCEIYIKAPGDSMSSSLPLASTADKKAFYLLAEELGFPIREWSYLHNYGEGRHYNLPQVKAPCPVIHGKRKEILNIAWNLDIIPCAYDFNGSIRFGNLKTATLEEIFSSPEYFSFLLAHANNDLSCHKACQNCERLDYT